MSRQVFDVLLLIARPAAGKSEIIKYLKQTPLDLRQKRFHVGVMDEIDDFPMIWTWFEEDALLAEMGMPRIHTDEEGYFLHPYQWNLLIRRISLEYQKRLRDLTKSPNPVTILVEFARGTEHGGFREAFQHLSAELLRNAAILYIDVSYEESLRKNRRRYNPDRPDSILEHGLPDDKMEVLYHGNDWSELTRGARKGRLDIQGIAVPFVVFENKDDVTTPGGEPLGRRLEERLGELWSEYSA